MSEARLREIWRGLDAAGRASLADYAEFLLARQPPTVTAVEPSPRPAVETVAQAIRRLNRTYRMLKRHQLAERVEALLAAHMIDDRPAVEVIDELERFYAEQYAKLSL
jgi:hypothetical protein